MHAVTYLESPFFDDPKDGHHIKWFHAGESLKLKGRIGYDRQCADPSTIPSIL